MAQHTSSCLWSTTLKVLWLCSALTLALLIWQTVRVYKLAEAYDQAAREYATYSMAAQRVIQHATSDDQEEGPEDISDQKKKSDNLGWIPLTRNWLSLRAGAREFSAGTPLEQSVAQLYTITDNATQPARTTSKSTKKQSQARSRVKRKSPQNTRTSLHRQARTSPALRAPLPELQMPLEEGRYWISSPFGPRRRADGSRGFHYGVDFAAMKGTPVYAAADGVVTEARNAHKGYGKTIVISHGPIHRTRYAHLHRILVHPGQRVEQGECIGLVGDTGFIRKKGSDGSHLHFEVSVRGTRINPLLALKR